MSAYLPNNRPIFTKTFSCGDRIERYVEVYNPEYVNGIWISYIKTNFDEGIEYKLFTADDELLSISSAFSYLLSLAEISISRLVDIKGPEKSWAGFKKA